MIKRGFSYSEIRNLPMPVFCSIELFDRFIEPSNIDTLDSMFARLNRTMYAASGKLDQEGLRRIKAADFKLIRDETIFKTPEDIEKEKQSKRKKSQENILNSLSPEEREKALKHKRAKNGK
ncbi:hypothetical protein NGC32_06285 [Kluyvera cryocrescens]|uniref:hypothetical protein n=1 Tax=Kluyvera cryocrescens TaxID=580 RepID=UPI002DB6D7A5|nr:hypothetical protein [Kluyvera cryocrescens]MEB7712333.1 hypothetical protein [Kluyvera cryocrescens]